MNFNNVALVQTIRPIVIGMKKDTSKPGSYARVAKDSALILSYALNAINLISDLIPGVNMLSEINERFPLVNVAEIYFAMSF